MKYKNTPTLHERGAFHVGQLVHTNAAFKRAYPRSRASKGVGRIMWFCRGTEVRVIFTFPTGEMSMQIDERFLEET